MTQKIMRSFQCTIAGLLLSCSVLTAQHKHEFSLYGGGGLSTLQYDVTAGKQKNGLGGHLGLGYHFFFSPKWGLGTGVEVAFYNARYDLDKYYNSYMATDIEGNDFEFRSTVNGYKEKQHATLLQIPLMLQFQTGSNHQFYASAGGKVGFPLRGDYENSNDGIINTGYYAKEDYEYTTQQFMGFGTFTDKNTSDDLSFKTAFFASAEAGVKWKLNESWSLYTGAYLDYGLNNIAEQQQTASTEPLVRYNAEDPRNFTVNNVFNAATSADKVIPVAAGLKLRLAFGKSRKEKKENDYTSTAAPFSPNNAPAETPPPVKEETPPQPAVAVPSPAVPLPVKQENRPLATTEKAPPAATVPVPVPQEEQLQPVGDYALSQVQLNVVQQRQWDKNIALLQQHPDRKIVIYGHTCNIGSEAINEKVGLQRAERVKAYLLSKGIAEDRILGTASKRDTEPLVSNDTAKHRKINRRVEVVYRDVF